MILQDKRVMVTGGTGSLGKVLVRRILTGELGRPRKVIVFSRDEGKHHAMRVAFQNKAKATDEVLYQDYQNVLDFHIGDVRDYHAVSRAMRKVDIVFNAAALKQVPACEYHPWEAIQTNLAGPQNIITAIQEHRLDVEAVVCVSTDKACKPVNVMGMTKAIQERLFLAASIDNPRTRFVAARYGNVLASRASVVPLFHEQIRVGGPLTITTTDMTRFLLSLDDAVDTVFAALSHGRRGELYIPRVPSALVTDLAAVMIGDRPIGTKIIGIRPGEKIHEILVSDEEAARTVDRGKYYVVQPILPELQAATTEPRPLTGEYSSAGSVMSRDALRDLMNRYHLLDPNHIDYVEAMAH